MRGINLLIQAFLRIEQKLALILEMMNLAVQLSAPVPKTCIWLDNQEVMQMLKISESTLRRWRISGLIPWTRIKGKYYYKDSDIHELLLAGL